VDCQNNSCGKIFLAARTIATSKKKEEKNKETQPTFEGSISETPGTI